MDKENASTSNQRSSETEKVSASAIVMSVPTFWPNKISLWFKQLEAQFAIAGITRDSTQFSYVIANLEEKYIEEIEDIIENPPEKDQYKAVKAGLIKRLSDFSSTRIRKLLEGEEIGDRTPTQFLRHLKTLAGSDINEDSLRNLWLNRLPVSVQYVLAPITEKSLSAMSEIADRIHEFRPEKGKIAMISPTSEINALREELQKLRVEINAISRARGPRGQGRWRGRSKSRGRNPSRNRENEGSKNLCWYHQKFSGKATKCRKPCNWKSGNDKNHY